MRRLLWLMALGGGVALAVVIGQRLSTDAMAVALGVVFGVVAGIPTSLLMVVALRGRRELRQREQAAPPPQIYIVNPTLGQAVPWLNQGQQAPGLMPGTGWPMMTEPPRRFKVVGEEERWLEAEEWDGLP